MIPHVRGGGFVMQPGHVQPGAHVCTGPVQPGWGGGVDGGGGGGGGGGGSTSRSPSGSVSESGGDGGGEGGGELVRSRNGREQPHCATTSIAGAERTFPLRIICTLPSPPSTRNLQLPRRTNLVLGQTLCLATAFDRAAADGPALKIGLSVAVRGVREWACRYGSPRREEYLSLWSSGSSASATSSSGLRITQEVRPRGGRAQGSLSWDSYQVAIWE